MWERACSRMRWISQHIWRLTPCLREQARSHIFTALADGHQAGVTACRGGVHAQRALDDQAFQGNRRFAL